MESKITYVVRVKGTDELVRVRTTLNESRECGEYRYELETGRYAEDLPVYELDDPKRLARALAKSTEWYNSSYEHPVHGQVSTKELEIVKRTVVETLEPLQVELPPTVKHVFSGKKPLSILTRYAGEPVPEEATTLSLFELPAGETVKSMKRFEGEDVESSTGWNYRLYKVFEVPEDYVPDLKGKPGFAAAIS